MPALFFAYSIAMNAIAPAAALSAVETQVLHIRGLVQRRDFATALPLAQALVQRVPENRDVLYLLALSLRGVNRVVEALATLEQLQRHHPGFSRLYQERGHCYVAQRDAAQAIDAFLRAVNINPALPASWAMLESLYKLTGQPDNARTAAEHVATLQQLPRDVINATGLFCD